MPEQVINWKSTEDSCSFVIKGMTDLSLKISEKIPFSKIIIIPGEDPPFNFNLICKIDKKSTNQTNTRIKHDDGNACQKPSPEFYKYACC